MTDHERLCELLKRVAGGITEPFCDCVQCDAARMLTCLLSKGPDGLRVVPVEPTK